MSDYRGIKDLMYAKVTKNEEGEYKVETPKRLAKIASCKKDYAGSTENAYYDDKLDEVLQGTVTKSLEIVVKGLDAEVEAELQGQIIVKGMKIESTQDITPYFAIGYRTLLGSGKYEFYWHYLCQPEPIGAEHNTKADKPAIAERTIKFACLDREVDGKNAVSINEDLLNSTTGATLTEAKALLAIDPVTKLIKWFSEVQEPLSAQGGTTTPVVASGLTVTSVASATVTGSTKITVTPTKASGNSYKYKSGASVTTPNVGDDTATGYQTWDGTVELAIATGQKILVVEVDATGKVVKAGQATVTSKA